MKQYDILAHFQSEYDVSGEVNSYDPFKSRYVCKKKYNEITDLRNKSL